MTRPRNNPSDSRRFPDWINASYQDLRAARLLISDETLHNATAFHCQQCAEKSLKGFLLAKTLQAADGHNLSWLCRRATSLDASFHEWLDECAALNRYYIETRYPTDIPTDISDAEAKTLLQMTENLFAYVTNELEIADELDELGAY